MKLALVVAMVAGMVGCDKSVEHYRYTTEVDIFDHDGRMVELWCLTDRQVLTTIDLSGKGWTAAKVYVQPHSEHCKENDQ